MQRRHRGDDVEGPAERMVHHVASNPFDACRLAPRAVQHALIEVDGDHLGNPCTKFGCEQSVAGPDVERGARMGGHRIHDQPMVVSVVIPSGASRAAPVTTPRLFHLNAFRPLHSQLMGKWCRAA
jgi:hypothetical protein